MWELVHVPDVSLESDVSHVPSGDVARVRFSSRFCVAGGVVLDVAERQVGGSTACQGLFTGGDAGPEPKPKTKKRKSK